MLETLSTILQVILGLGLLNVWLVRPGKSTAYRGGDSTSLKEEFAAYGLPPLVFYVVGALKIGAAIGLLAGIAVPSLVLPSAALLAGLMVAALAMHLRVGDEPSKSIPAVLMLLMSGIVTYLAST